MFDGSLVLYFEVPFKLLVKKQMRDKIRKEYETRVNKTFRKERKYSDRN